MGIWGEFGKKTSGCLILMFIKMYEKIVFQNKTIKQNLETEEIE